MRTKRGPLSAQGSRGLVASPPGELGLSARPSLLPASRTLLGSPLPDMLGGGDLVHRGQGEAGEWTSGGREMPNAPPPHIHVPVAIRPGVQVTWGAAPNPCPHGAQPILRGLLPPS